MSTSPHWKSSFHSKYMKSAFLNQETANYIYAKESIATVRDFQINKYD